MKILMLDTITYGDDISLDAFRGLGEVVCFTNSTHAEAVERVKEHQPDVIVVNKVVIDEEIFAASSNIKMVAETATGYNNIDIEYAKVHGIRVANVAGYSTDSVVQHTFALLFYVYEKLRSYDDYVKSGAYTDAACFSYFSPTFYELAGKTWGIVGLGTIGKGVAKIAEAFGCKVIYYSASGTKQENVAYDCCDFDTFLSRADIVSIHAPLNEKTQYLFDENAFDKMKSSAVLLNLGRGPIVNDAALANALLEGKIAAAGLDVIEVEPMEKGNPLLKVQDSSKLIVTPHIGWATYESRTRLMEMVYENIAAYFRGEERNVIV